MTNFSLSDFLAQYSLLSIPLAILVFMSVFLKFNMSER